MTTPSLAYYAASLPGTPGFFAAVANQPQKQADINASLAAWRHQGASITLVSAREAMDGLALYQSYQADQFCPFLPVSQSVSISALF